MKEYKKPKINAEFLKKKLFKSKKEILSTNDYKTYTPEEANIEI